MSSLKRLERLRLAFSSLENAMELEKNWESMDVLQELPLSESKDLVEQYIHVLETSLQDAWNIFEDDNYENITDKSYHQEEIGENHQSKNVKIHSVESESAIEVFVDSDGWISRPVSRISETSEFDIFQQHSLKRKAKKQKLLEAVWNGNVAKVNHILDSFPSLLNFKNRKTGRSLFMLACEASQLRVAETLAMRGCDVNVTDNSGMNALDITNNIDDENFKTTITKLIKEKKRLFSPKNEVRAQIIEKAKRMHLKKIEEIKSTTSNCYHSRREKDFAVRSKMKVTVPKKKLSQLEYAQRIQKRHETLQKKMFSTFQNLDNRNKKLKGAKQSRQKNRLKKNISLRLESFPRQRTKDSWLQKNHGKDRPSSKTPHRRKLSSRSSRSSWSSRGSRSCPERKKKVFRLKCKQHFPKVSEINEIKNEEQTNTIQDFSVPKMSSEFQFRPSKLSQALNYLTIDEKYPTLSEAGVDENMSIWKSPRKTKEKVDLNYDGMFAAATIFE
eukprot:g3819.t1